MSISHFSLQAILYHAVRLVLGIVFLLSALLKMRSYEELAYTISLMANSLAATFGATQFTPRLLAWKAIAMAVIAGELCLGIAFLLNARIKSVSVLASVFLACCTAALFALMRLGRSCGCFGVDGEAVSWLDIVRNSMLIACTLFLYWLNDRNLYSVTTKNNMKNNNASASTHEEKTCEIQQPSCLLQEG